MSLVKFLGWSASLLVLAGCSSLMQSPFGPTPYSSSVGSASGTQVYGIYPTQTAGPQRTEYLWQKALEGMTLGGAIAGPYGAGGGPVLGVIAGLFTANAHQAQLNNQIQTEQVKDKELEAKIEEEMERQRKLEAQLGVTNVSMNTAQQPIAPADSSVKRAASNSTIPANGS